MQKRMSSKNIKSYERPRRKWTHDEVLQIVEFIKEEKEFEKPTAQCYYRKFLEETKIDTSWDLVRWKVRHLKSLFKKAEDWKNAIESGSLEKPIEKPSVEDTVRKICPFYEEFSEAFGGKYSTSSKKFDTLDSSDVVGFENKFSTSLKKFDTFDSEQIDVTLEPDESVDDDYPSVPFVSEEPVKNPLVNCESYNSTESIVSPFPETSTLNGPNKKKLRYSRRDNSQTRFLESKAESKKLGNSTDQLIAIQHERNEYLKMKLNLEKDKFKEEIALKKRHLELEELKLKEEMELQKQELELKRLKIEQDERLKKFEIEKQERVEMYEIDTKYKYVRK